ncbi:hypothetical protein BV902_02135 [Sphingobacterium sp. B29]|uniref:glycosyltransferase n=1 Tax=Sphingobacterium sp. B29 TaxID=1933220 RepID=UPI00095839D8|nr:glycosyltransferase [Sphingobacterium sp. B29]APU95276.1 hypothetical protein BV902_02135 [Sphingobacterium sp. B29]
MVSVVFVVHTFDESQIGGVLKITSMQANALARRGWKVCVLSLGQITRPAYKLDDNVELVCLNLKYYDTRQLSGIKKIFFFSKSYRRVLNFVKTQHNAIFITTSAPINILFSLFKQRFKVFGCDHTATTYSKNGLTFVVNLLKRRLDCMIALTPEDTLYYKNSGITSKCIPNFIERDITEKNHLGNDVAFIGRFSKEKNPLGALRIFYLSRLYEKGVKMKLYGYGDLKHDMLTLIKDYDIQSFVSIVEGEKDPNVMLKDVRCLLLTSEIEGFPMVLLEAMSKGIYCISYDVGYGPKNIIENGINGFLVEEGEEQKAAGKLVDIFSGSGGSSPDKIRNSIDQFYTEGVIEKWEILLKEFSRS